MSMFLDYSLRDVLALMQTRCLERTFYRGVPTPRPAIDAWVYQEIIHDTRPDFVIEIGNYMGGGLLYLADVCAAVGHGHVIGVDIIHSGLHPLVATDTRITTLTGDATCMAPEVFKVVGGGSALVIEDSSHSKENTLSVLRAYARMVPRGQYFVVEDTICGHGLDGGGRPGPAEAVAEFLTENDEWEADLSREWPISWNSGGYLRRR